VAFTQLRDNLPIRASLCDRSTRLFRCLRMRLRDAGRFPGTCPASAHPCPSGRQSARTAPRLRAHQPEAISISTRPCSSSQSPGGCRGFLGRSCVPPSAMQRGRPNCSADGERHASAVRQSSRGWAAASECPGEGQLVRASFRPGSGLKRDRAGFWSGPGQGEGIG
jgi:hypothetical protein